MASSSRAGSSRSTRSSSAAAANSATNSPAFAANSTATNAAATAAKHEASFVQKFKEVIECTICYDFPPSPVFKCANDHIVCGVCAEQMGPCGLCRAKLVRFNFGDKMLRELDLLSKCNFFEAGCKSVVKCTEMRVHLKKCFFRDILCSEMNTFSEEDGSRRGCKEKKVPFNKFNQHLEQVHKSVTLVGPKVQVYRFLEQNPKEPKYWRLVNISYDGKIFMWQVYVTADTLYTWMTVLGDEVDAGKYNCSLELMNPIPVPAAYERKMLCSLQVFPYHNYTMDIKSTDGSPSYSTVPMKELHKLGVTVGNRERLLTNLRITKKLFY